MVELVEVVEIGAAVLVDVVVLNIGGGVVVEVVSGIGVGVVVLVVGGD